MPILPDDPTSPTLRIAQTPFRPTEAKEPNEPREESDPAAKATTEDLPDDAEREPQERAYRGADLREIRESQGLSLGEISDRTKISRTILLAIEEERYEDIPNARVYVRGFVRCVARELGLDLDAVSNSYVPPWERWYAEQSPP